MFTGCDHTESPFRLGGKWTAKIVRCLEEGPRRFSELAVPLRGITPKVLTETLRHMERDGLITRTVGDGIPPRVDYALSPLGRSLLAPMAACCAWAAAHLPEVEGAREAYARVAGSAVR
ncbi:MULTISPECIES: winged helix-turn-helix transcriptional regulator [unclassified Streptomyces]|uniref:winged helix-turn-helix transcriptional regulator n=1 Tax=unclassified Streptomyces TaxID=2593676 RepID=UPI00036CE9DA|nr:MULTISPECIES: helix-turn-helix domain-containing protein [unclassified Streptomyces]MYQ75503.1 transcriptional regulator [Streptomyces sp. SID4923]